jgi:hypothetical protein
MTGSYRPPPASDQGPAAPSGFFPRACPLPGFDVLSVGLVVGALFRTARP